MQQPATDTFRLRFFGGFASQRRALLAARELAAPALHSSIHQQLNALGEDSAVDLRRLDSRWKLFWRCVLAVRELVLASILWNALSAIVVLLAVLATRRIVAQEDSLSTAFVLAIGYLAAKVAYAAIDYFDWLRRAQVNRGVQTFLFRVVNAKVVRIDRARAHEFTTGNIKTLIGSDVESVEDFISAALAQWIPTLVTLAILGPSMYWFGGTLGVIALTLALLSLPVAMLGAHYIERYQSRAQKEQDRLTTLVGEWVKNIRLVRFLGWQRAIEDEIARQMRSFTWQYAFRHTIACVVYGVSWSWWMVPVLGMLAAAYLQGIELSVASVFSVIWLLDHLMNYVQHLPYSLSLYGQAGAGADRVLALLGAPEVTDALVDSNGSAEAPHGVPQRVHFRDVSLELGGRKVLQAVNVCIELHSRTAIVGSVGSGKSLLLELLVGEKAPSSGSIEVEYEGGQRFSLWRRDVYESLRSQIAYTPGQPFLSNALMRLNIDLGGSGEQASIAYAAERAQLVPDIQQLTRGYDEEVGETGINLSGGQRQRVSLARAFFSARPFFVLDDPLSAVDPATEAALMDNLIDSAKGIVMVSHRLQELSRCDRVLVMDGGSFVEDGNPLELASDRRSRFSAFLRAVEEHGH